MYKFKGAHVFRAKRNVFDIKIMDVNPMKPLEPELVCAMCVGCEIQIEFEFEIKQFEFEFDFLVIHRGLRMITR